MDGGVDGRGGQVNAAVAVVVVVVGPTSCALCRRQMQTAEKERRKGERKEERLASAAILFGWRTVAVERQTQSVDRDQLAVEGLRCPIDVAAD